MRLFLLVSAAWVALGLAGGGIFNAHMGAMGSDIADDDWCRRKAAQHQSFSIIMGIVGGPVSPIATLAVTGFAQDGWSLGRRACGRTY